MFCIQCIRNCFKPFLHVFILFSPRAANKWIFIFFICPFKVLDIHQTKERPILKTLPSLIVQTLKNLYSLYEFMQHHFLELNPFEEMFISFLSPFAAPTLFGNKCQSEINKRSMANDGVIVSMVFCPSVVMSTSTSTRIQKDGTPNVCLANLKPKSAFKHTKSP